MTADQSPRIQVAPNDHQQGEFRMGAAFGLLDILIANPSFGRSGR